MFAGAHSRQTREDEDAHLSPAREMSNQGVNPVALGALLVVQNAGAVLLMRYTRSIPGETEFNTQTAVIMQEVLKGLTCVVILLATEGTVASAWAKPVEALKTAVPALLYLLQNNLQYVAVGYLDAASYTVSYQTKTIWSGILSMVLLNRTLGPNKWLGIVTLSIGVATVQVAGMAREEEEGGGALEPEELPGGLGGRMFGLAVVLFAAAVSSCAGVYFEKILKGVKVSLWTRNLQLAGYSVVVGLVKLMLSDDGAVMRVNGNFFMGYTPMTWLCVATNAFGGLLVGTVIKYADAVLKDVALGASIAVSSLVSTLLFPDFALTPLFCSGVALVIYAVFLYGGRAKCCGLVDALEAKGQAKPGESAASVAPLLPEKEPPVEKI